MREVDIIGVGMTQFGRLEGSTLASLGSSAIQRALADAGVTADSVGLVVHGNAMAGVLTGQQMIRGQVVITDTGLSGKPVINVENACATASTGVHVALAAIRAGLYDTAVVCGTEKMTHRSTAEVLAAMTSGTDVERLPQITKDVTGDPAFTGSFFMEIYAAFARDYMATSGATIEDFADVAAKNSGHGALNPLAQYRQKRTREEILASRLIAAPLHLLMCSPIADGAAAIVLQAADVRGRDPRAVRIQGTALRSGVPGMDSDVEALTAAAAYEQAGVGPEDIDVVEVHDAASPNELAMYEKLSFCAAGEGPAFLASGATALDGRVPFNPSGGLVSRGHPVGATGCAQLIELTTQIRGEAGDRQVEGARIGLAENAGGYLHPEAAACTVTILGKAS
ncbi:thiolase family protein [Nonomuraea jabiensis]|uniref:thiolase family protein n=1 Tax=Nonomuraea jabiensis TaxID=882448 RepID=UPI00344765D6